MFTSIACFLAALVLAVKAGMVSRDLLRGIHISVTIALAVITTLLYAGKLADPESLNFTLCPTSKEAIENWILEEKLDAHRK